MSIWKYLFSLERRRNWIVRKMPESPLRAYYEIPFPDMEADWRQADYLALDYETTGLDPKTDEIISIGFTTIRGDCMQLGDAQHLYARPTRDIPEASAVIHGILDDKAAAARPLEEVLPILLSALSGKAMLAHHAAIEYHFLNNACKKIYGHPFIGPVVDTLALEVQRHRARDRAMHGGALRLDKSRDRYGLPRYPAHNALTDAIAAGELFLAQAAYRGEKKTKLKRLTVIS